MARLTIDVTQEDLLDLQVDACICGIHRSKNLGKGRLSGKISNAAGPNLQKQLESVSPHRDLNQGEVRETRPEKLSTKFQAIYFVCLRSWQEGNDEDLQAAIERILDDAGGKRLTSVALPALGTGQKYPTRKVALAILQACMAHSIDNPESSLTSVKVSLFEQKDEMLQAFTDILMTGVRVYETYSQDHVTDNHSSGDNLAVDNAQQRRDQNGNPDMTNKKSLLARPVLSPRRTNMLGWIWSYFGKAPPVYTFLVGPMPVGVSPFVNARPTRGAGAELTIGVTFSVSALPTAVKAALTKVFNQS